MREYVIEREIEGAGTWTEDQIRETSIESLAIMRGLGGQIQWLHSYVTDHKIFVFTWPRMKASFKSTRVCWACLPIAFPRCAG